VRVASEEAKLSMRFIRVGIFPELASTRLLVEIVGLNHALELMETGRIIDAQEAGRIGLVNHVVPHDRFLDRAVEIASEIAFNPTESVQALKRTVWENFWETDQNEVMKRETIELNATMNRPHFKEAVKAFLEKRQPDFHKDVAAPTR
jgi:enoyl-CoA hydratase/carnithine racemase